MNHRFLTMRMIFEQAVLRELFEEKEFASHQINSAPTHDHFLAVFVFESELQDDGTLLLRAVSTTVAGIQKHSVKRLLQQGIYVMVNPKKDRIPFETLRSHFRAKNQRLITMMISPSNLPRSWTSDFENGAGALDPPLEFAVRDPELAELEALFGERQNDDEFNEGDG